MAKSKVKNAAKGTVSTGYDASATSIVLSAGHGATFPSSGNFYLAWWNVTDYPDPTDDPNYELIQITARSTDTLTIVRGRDGTSASTKNASGKTYKVMLPVTAALLDELLENVLTTRGDIVTQGASGPQRVGLGTRGGCLMSDGTDTRWLSIENHVYWEDDFVGDVASAGGWTATNGSSGTSPTIGVGTADRPGVLSLISGTASSTAVSVVRKQTTNGFGRIGNGLIEIRFAFRTKSGLSDAANLYILRFGLSDGSTSTPANGVYIEMDTSAVIKGVGRKASTDTNTSSTVAGTDLQWYDCKIVIDSTASTAEFFVDGTSLGTVSSSNLPNTADLGCFCQLTKAGGSTGTTDKRAEVDYFTFYKELSTARQ